MTARTTPPFRADHVGSLLRPPEVSDARARHEAREITAAELREIEDEAVAAAVALRRRWAWRPHRRGNAPESWHMDFISRSAGSPSERWAADAVPRPRRRLAFSARAPGRGRVRLEQTIFGDDFATSNR